MNDDFLRRMRRPPSPAFEKQLRERLREQEIKETSRRRPSWRLLTIFLLIGGSALATATYLTLTRPPVSPPPVTQNAAPETAPDESLSEPRNRFLEGPPPAMRVYGQTGTNRATSSSAPQASEDIATTRADARASSDGATNDSRYIAPTIAPGFSTPPRPLRLIATPDIAALVRFKSPSSSFEIDSADKALPTLCAEEPAAQPHIVVTSRRVRKEELKLCAKGNGSGVVETTLGHIAVVVTRAKTGAPMQLTTRALRLALQKQVPAPDNSSQLIDNPYTYWNQIDPSLEDRRIEILGPARGTPEFIIFAATLLAPACENNASLDPDLCQSVREDGIYAEARFDDTFVSQRLWSDPNVVAIMDYPFYAANSSDLLSSLLVGPAPTRQSILDGSYVGARTLHVYVNRVGNRNVPRVSLFVNEYLRSLPTYQHRKVMLAPDGTTEWRTPYSSGPKLTEVKLD